MNVDEIMFFVGDCYVIYGIGGKLIVLLFEFVKKLCAMSQLIANLNPYSQDVEEGQLPNCGNHQANNGTDALLDQHRKQYQPEQRPNNRTAETNPDFNHQHEHRHQLLDHKEGEIQYEIIKTKHYPKDYSNSPDKKKKSHKSQHKSKHTHKSYGQERQRQKQINRYDIKSKERQPHGTEKKKNLNNGVEKDQGGGAPSMMADYYQPPPYYPPYMYPPMPPHMPPSSMYPYQYPPPYMPMGSYPYGGMPMVPPMEIPPPPSNYGKQKGAQKYQHPPPPSYEIGPPSYRPPGNEGPGVNQPYSQKLGENPYKMFPGPGHYMYHYPPPPMGYGGYPPPPYMMYPPQQYDARGDYGQPDDQLRTWRRRQLIDNQKQRVRKALKHLSSETKSQMLDTIRIVLKLDKKAISETYPHQKEHQNFQSSTIERCYQRNLLKIDKWFKEEDDRIRQALNHLLTAFQMDDIRHRIKELKQYQKAQLECMQSQTRRLIDRLIINSRQTIF